MSNPHFGHWPTTLQNILRAAEALGVAAVQPNVQPQFRKTYIQGLQSALIAAEECKQGIEHIAEAYHLRETHGGDESEGPL